LFFEKIWPPASGNFLHLRYQRAKATGKDQKFQLFLQQK
jgi:hypothetical protein